MQYNKEQTGGDIMSKGVSFTENDEELIKQIEQYQKSCGLPSFISAVRKLCGDALELKKIIK